MPTKIPCPECHGKGEVPLPEWAVEVMALFKPKNAELTSEQVSEKTGDEVTLNAINNRLERLRDLHFLKRRRVGKWWHYSKK